MQPKPNLSVFALISFIASFLVARTFTTFYPTVVFVNSGIHVHHFWYGIALLAVGGWLGISYNNERISRLAAILFGAGGGLIGDEVGLLLTFEDYWTGITYTFVLAFLAFASTLIIILRYQKAIWSEFAQFTRSNASLYFGAFLAAVSIAFFMETEEILINTISVVMTIVAGILILAYFIQKIMRRQQKPV
jgi:hypothetical protein